MADVDYEKIREIIHEELTPVWMKLDRHDVQIGNCEKKDAAAEAVSKTNKDSTSTIVAVAALIISLIATAANIFGG